MSTKIMENYFSLEPLLIARLADIEGLDVISVADVDDKKLLNADKPTAVIAFQGDDKVDSNPGAILMRSSWSVSLFVRSSVKERQDEEGQLLLAIVQRVHGWTPGGAFGSLELQSVTPDAYDNGTLREYAMLFELATTLYTRGN